MLPGLNCSSLADVQEICLLTMLRVSAKCESFPPEVLQTVQKLQEAAGRHIKKVMTTSSCYFVHVVHDSCLAV